MKRVIISSATISHSGASSAALSIAEDFAYCELEGSAIWVNDEGLPCDNDGNLIDLMDDCDYGDLRESEYESIAVTVTTQPMEYIASVNCEPLKWTPRFTSLQEAITAAENELGAYELPATAVVTEAAVDGEVVWETRN